ncbi:FtsX-like permease family protein [bacterium]|nr:FtsX-like permease family protein [bacterium]
MMIWLRLAWREIINTPKFSLFFVMNIALGLVGFIAVDALKSSIDESLSGKSREILGADISVSAFRQLNPDEIARFDSLVPRTTRIAEETGWVSMVSAITRETQNVAPPARLMEIRAVDKAFPFYGEISFTNESGHDSQEKIFERMNVEPVAIAAPELFVQLELKPGSEVKIGDQVFRLAGSITNDPSTSSASFSIAPRIYIGQAWVAKTGLVQLGSRIVHTRKYAVTPGTVEEAPLEAKFKAFAKSRSDIRVRSHTSATDELGRILKFLGDYLGIVALVAIILSALGCNFLILAHIRSKIRDLAILQSIGARPSSARWIIGWQMALLGTGGSIAAIALAAALMPSVKDVLAPFLGSGIQLRMQLDSIVTALILGSIGTPVAGLPAFAHLNEMNAASLFREHEAPSNIRATQWFIAAIPAISIIFSLATWQARSIKTGLVFLVITGASILILGTAGFLLLRSIDQITRWLKKSGGRYPWPVMMALRNSRRSSQGLMISLITLGLCSALLSAVPQIQAILTSELSSTGNTILPGLFLFDIQPEQEAPLRQFLAIREIHSGPFSPLIRARLERINGKPVAETFDTIPGTQERRTEEQFKNRTYNLSFRARLSPSETLAAGREFAAGRFDPSLQEMPEISIEKRFSERTGIRLQDILDFDIQGVPVKGRVVNLRRVRWASFQPNFFVQFQEGVIDEAPRTSLCTIPQMDFDKTQQLQRELTREFPNISIIDVKASVARILSISAQVATAVTAMALLCLIAGIGVLTAITLQQSRTRAYETAIMKVLGASFTDILFRIFVEAGIVAIFGATCGLAISFGIAWVISVFLFDGVWVFAAGAATVPAAMITVTIICVTMLASRIALAAHPRKLLQPE